MNIVEMKQAYKCPKGLPQGVKKCYQGNIHFWKKYSTHLRAKMIEKMLKYDWYKIYANRITTNKTIHFRTISTASILICIDMWDPLYAT